VTAVEDRRSPYLTQNLVSRSSAGRGQMPKTLDGLLRWFVEGWEAEIPRTIHSALGWSAEDGAIERGPEKGWEVITDRGGSRIGTHRWSGDFRSYLESGSGGVDEDGYYIRPIHNGLNELRKREPIMARVLFGLGQTGGDWALIAKRGHWPLMEMEMPVPEFIAEHYFRECLIRLWNATNDRTLRGLR